MPSLSQRLARLRPYLRPGRRGLIGAGLGALVGAATEPMIPALLKPLLDQGFTPGPRLPLWWVPAVMIGLFACAGWPASWRSTAWPGRRSAPCCSCARRCSRACWRAQPGLFTRQTASQLTNTLVYEVQQGATQLIGALLTLVKDSLTLVALLAYLLWLNWQLTLFVGLLFPALAVVMRTWAGGCTG
jgi:subfamily B ATP-binding cassette protein MsbA